MPSIEMHNEPEPVPALAVAHNRSTASSFARVPTTAESADEELDALFAAPSVVEVVDSSVARSPTCSPVPSGSPIRRSPTSSRSPIRRRKRKRVRARRKTRGRRGAARPVASHRSRSRPAVVLRSRSREPAVLRSRQNSIIETMFLAVDRDDMLADDVENDYRVNSLIVPETRHLPGILEAAQAFVNGTWWMGDDAFRRMTYTVARTPGVFLHFREPGPDVGPSLLDPHHDCGLRLLQGHGAPGAA